MKMAIIHLKTQGGAIVEKCGQARFIEKSRKGNIRIHHRFQTHANDFILLPYFFASFKQGAESVLAQAETKNKRRIEGKRKNTSPSFHCCRKGDEQTGQLALLPYLGGKFRVIDSRFCRAEFLDGRVHFLPDGRVHIVKALGIAEYGRAVGQTYIGFVKCNRRSGICPQVPRFRGFITDTRATGYHRTVKSAVNPEFST